MKPNKKKIFRAKSKLRLFLLRIFKALTPINVKYNETHPIVKKK